MRAVVPRERERERTRKSERGRREIATLATTGATLLHTLFCRKSSRTTSTRKKIYAPILCVRTSLPVLLLYTLAIPSSSSPRSNDSFSFFLSVLRSFSPIYVRACIRVCICARLYPLRVSNPWCECACERRKENEWNRDRGRLTRECGTERKGGARGGGARSGERDTGVGDYQNGRARNLLHLLLLCHCRLFLRFYSSSSVDRHAASRANRQAHCRTRYV